MEAAMSGSDMGLYTMLSMQQALIGRLLESGGSSSLEELLQPRRRSGKEIAAEALTGLIRSDARVLRQAERNAYQGKDMAGILQTAADGMVEALVSMRSVADKVAAGTATSADELLYDDAKAAIDALIKGAEYNGISLMDNANWANDDRLTVKNGGKNATMDISLGKSTRAFTLTDMNSMLDLPAYAALTTPSERDKVSTAQKNMGLYASGYKGIAASYESSAEALKRQSGITERSASLSILGARDDPMGRLLYYLLTEHGKIVNKPL
jgi:flagellin-like hook-associated protein FlgL